MTKFSALLAIVLVVASGARAAVTLPAPSKLAVTSETNGTIFSPTNFFWTNLVAGSNVSLSMGVGGKVTINTSGGGGGGVVAAVTNLNGQAQGTQTFQTGTTGTDFGISSASGVHTFNIPTASASNRGLLTSADHTSFAAKVGTINGLTGVSQSFATGTTGTDFGIASVGTTHTFNIPTASGSARGALASADFTTFAAKVGPARTITAGSGLSGGGDLSTDRTISLASTSSGISGALSDETGSGALVFGTTPTIATPAITGAIDWQAGVRQTFEPTTTTPALNTGSVASDPSSLSNGDLWTLSGTGRTRIRSGSQTADVANGYQYDFVTSTISSSSSIAVDLAGPQYQTCTLATDTTLTSANRPSGVGRAVTVFFTASGAQRVVTLNAAWKNFGSGSSLTIPSGKEGFVTLMCFGTTESDVRCVTGVSQ